MGRLHGKQYAGESCPPQVPWGKSFNYQENEDGDHCVEEDFAEVIAQETQAP